MNIFKEAASTTEPIRQRQLLQMKSNEININLSYNPKLIPEIQQQLVNNSELIRENLAGNPALIPTLQQEFLRTGSFWVKKYLIYNPNLLPEVFRELLPEYQDYRRKRYNNPETQKLLETYLLLV